MTIFLVSEEFIYERFVSAKGNSSTTNCLDCGGGDVARGKTLLVLTSTGFAAPVTLRVEGDGYMDSMTSCLACGGDDVVEGRTLSMLENTGFAAAFTLKLKVA